MKSVDSNSSFLRAALFLRDDIAAMWPARDPFRAAQEQQGVIYRNKEGRRTLRFEHQGHGYFLKLHQGVGWKEIIKNLAQGRLPILGAENEYRAIRALENLGIDTLSVAAYGRHGCNPATQLSFLITDELQNVETLEDFCARWPQQPPTFALKRKLIARVAAIAHTMHDNGINHRDFYLCHFLLQNDSPPVTADNLDVRKLYLMDLHRAQIRARVPQRWLIKDLGGLYYSALDIGLTRRDIFRFMRAYTQRSLRDLLAQDNVFWNSVRERARRIYVRDHRREPQSSTWKPRAAFLPAFRSSTRNLPNKLTLNLLVAGNPVSFRSEAILRLLPGKRVVLKGTLGDQTVVLKLFVRSTSSAHHIQRERDGYTRVVAADVPCPALLAHCISPCGQFEGLIYEFVADANELSRSWQQFEISEKQQCLQLIMQTMLALHRAGASQSDIHADNFMLQKDKVYLLDMDSIECREAPLARAASIRNLGELIAQFAIAERTLFDTAIDTYFRERSWQNTEELKSELQIAITAAWRARKRDYLRKAQRDCTLTAFDKSLSQVRAYRRSWHSDELMRFFREPDAVMQTGELLKAGNTATVVKATFAGRPVVIKRYNIKNWQHALSRSLRPTRAEHSWHYAHLLELAGIESLKPVALLERRFGPLRSTAYFVGTWIDAPDLLATGSQRALDEHELDALTVLLHDMHSCRLSHGDFKANNLLLCDDRIAVIDLDAMSEHSSERSWQKAFSRDIARLLRNWTPNQKVHQQIKELTENALAIEYGPGKR